MSIPFESLTDNQKRAIEARLRVNEDPELARFPLTWIGRDRRGYGLVKTRFQTSVGLMGREAGWVIDNVPAVDYSQITTAGANTYRTLFTTFPLFNPAHVLGSLDPEPFEQSTLTAVSGDRQVGTSSQQIAVLLGVYLIHITSAGAVYNPAATTLNVRVFSSSAATGGGFTTQATINAATASNFVDQVPISATTGRTISITGTSLTNIAGLFNGDTLIGELVVGGALTVVSNVLAAMAEIV